MVRSIKNLIYSMLAALIVYSLFAIYLPEEWIRRIAPLYDFFAVGLVFHAVLKARNNHFKLNSVLIGIALLFWALADIFFILYTQILQNSGGDSVVVIVCYLGTNIFILCAMLLYGFVRLAKWNTVLLILDGLAFSLATIWLLWVLMLNKEYAALGGFADNSIVNLLSVIIDLFLILISVIWFVSSKKLQTRIFFRTTGAFVTLYALIDLVHFYQLFQHLNIPRAVFDSLHMLTIFGLAFTIKLYYLQFPLAYEETGDLTDAVNHWYKAILLAAYPCIMILLRGFVLIDFLFYVILISLYELARTYINKAVSDRNLLLQELITNRELERVVSEQTHDLKIANDELRKKNADLNFINLHDSLTGLHNRVYFLEHLESSIKAAAGDEQVVLILWNVDNLKGINDTYGHFTGDHILKEHARRVKKAMNEIGLLARLGGDEFAYSYRGRLSEDEYQHMANKVIATCKEPIRVNQYYFNISVCAGIALYPDCAQDMSSLLKNADIAMHYAKENKPATRISAYMDIDLAMKRKYLIANRLKTADYDKVLSLHFQPQFSINNLELVGMEALLRWNCEDIGAVSPAEFIPIAEAENLIIPIGNWVIANAVKQIADWNRTYHANYRMGINISPKQLDQTSTLTLLDMAIKRSKAKFDWIDIEITEGVALDQEDSAANIKDFFGHTGITISIDDFGTGYSSLGYLTILSFDRLKIAKPLIDKITTEVSFRKIITSIILLAKSLDLQTVAEGVETKEQFDLLKDLGCDQIQGFYLGKPLPGDVFEDMYLKRLQTD